MNNLTQNIIDLCLKTISKQFLIKNPKMQELGGAIKAVDCILMNKNQIIINNKNNMKSLYEYNTKYLEIYLKLQ